MKGVQYDRNIRVLFDEYHSESWSVSRLRAEEINPGDSINSSYQEAAEALTAHGFSIRRNIEQPLCPAVLKDTDILVLPHPCDPKWERTTSSNSPKLSDEEIADVRAFVRVGGGLLVISEYEYDKYRSNLNELLAPFGLAMENSTVIDRAGSPDNPTRIAAEALDGPLAHGVHAARFYQAGSCKADGAARVAWKSSSKALPPDAGLVSIALAGEGRVILVSDSSLFGDEHLRDCDHEKLWLNLFYWLAVPASRRLPIVEVDSAAQNSDPWGRLKSSVNALRLLQNADGSVAGAAHVQASAHVFAVRSALDELKPLFPHQELYLGEATGDLRAWAENGFGKPDFGRSLAAFNPQKHRVHNREHLVVFPLYTPNASMDTRFEALIIRTPWPEWLAALETDLYWNERFVPGHLVDYTAGYDSQCAVLFPEMISVKSGATNNFAIIFCDREAARLQRYAVKATAATCLQLHPQLECFLGSLAIMQDATGLWDLIHDKSHGLGELPFDPFMIRQRAPYWMYALEELRVDLRSFCEAARLARDGFSFAVYVTYAVLLDRIFRFPITGPRVRNYDALGGQLLFAYLHRKDVLIWRDNRLTIEWERLLEAVSELREEIARLYKLGATCSRMNLWLAAHELISAYLRPNIASKWKADSREVSDETDVKKWLGMIQDDEFPLGTFHLNLQRKLSQPV
ncbi:MAG TPA: DUF6421 family protein [Terrimicrobiaceae bacterium]